LDVYAENTFESFGPNGVKIYAKGKISIPMIKVQETFGVPYDNIDLCEKKLVWHCLIITLILDYHEKEPNELLFADFGFETTGTNPVKEMRSYKFDEPSFCRKFTKSVDKYRMAITLSSLCYKGVFYGVKAVVYNMINCTESGVF